MTDYILPLEYSGQEPDFRTMTRIKHPLQSLLKHYFKGQPIEVKILRDYRSELEIRNFNGDVAELRRAISIANRTQAKHGTEMNRLRLDAEKLYELTMDIEHPELEPETDESLRIELQTLEELLTTEKKVYETEIIEVKNYAHNLEGQLKLKEKEFETATRPLRAEIESLEKTNRAMSEAKRKAEADARGYLANLKKLEKDYESLSKFVEEISAAKITEPAHVVVQKISEVIPVLEKISNNLEKWLQADSNIDELLTVGKEPFYNYVNMKFTRSFSSNEEVMRVLEFKTPFLESAYAKENTAKYENVKKVLPLLENVLLLSQFGIVKDVTTALEKEEELKKFREEYEQKEKEHNENFEVSSKLQPLKEFYDRAYSLADYSLALQGRKIPCLITAKFEEETINVTFPKAGDFFSNQFAQIILNTIEDRLTGGETTGDNTQTYVFTLKPEQDIIQEYMRITRDIFDAQPNVGFYKLGMRLQINTVAQLQ